MNGKGTQHTSKCQHSRNKDVRMNGIKSRRCKIIFSTVAVLILLSVAILLTYKLYSEDGADSSALIGTWCYDQYTEYEFDGRGNGCMCLDGSTHYEFTYKIKGDTLQVDFVLEYVTDCEYTFSVTGDHLILIGGEGTAEIGKVYELTRK